jgi:MOSC domain-containing protein YiiM
VHLLEEEVLDELKQAGFVVNPGALGENVTTRGLNLLTLPLGARLRLGTHAVVEVTGLREPWRQMNKFARGLAAAVLDRDAEGRRTPKAGVMTIVIRGGDVKAGDDISVELPAGAHRPLKPL